MKQTYTQSISKVVSIPKVAKGESARPVLPKVAFEKNAKIYKILANEIRLEILNNIKYRELSVEQLLKITGLPKANLSQHLALLRHNRLVTNRRQGQNVYYKIVDPRIIEPCVLLHDLWRQKAFV